jgi:uncharacterized protein YndB with AHSA1/START domain
MAMRRNLTFERVYPYTPEQVWDALTDPAALADWLMDNDFQPYVGHRFTFRTKAVPGFDGIVYCEVTAVEKPHRLSYTWQASAMKQPTMVTWTLTSVPEGTRLRLDHSGFDGLASIAISFILGSGWGTILRKHLPDTLERLRRKGSAA